MSTNYFWISPSGEPRHIGKSSRGWAFALHVYPDEGICSLEDWEALWEKPGSVLKDEYEAKISPATLSVVIRERSFRIKGPTPFGLRMRDTTGRLEPYWRSVGATPGPGSWDLVEGEFS